MPSTSSRWLALAAIVVLAAEVSATPMWRGNGFDPLAFRSAPPSRLVYDSSEVEPAQPPSKVERPRWRSKQPKPSGSQRVENAPSSSSPAPPTSPVTDRQKDLALHRLRYLFNKNRGQRNATRKRQGLPEGKLEDGPVMADVESMTAAEIKAKAKEHLAHRAIDTKSKNVKKKAESARSSGAQE